MNIQPTLFVTFETLKELLDPFEQLRLQNRNLLIFNTFSINCQSTVQTPDQLSIFTNSKIRTRNAAFLLINTWVTKRLRSAPKVHHKDTQSHNQSHNQNSPNIYHLNNRTLRLINLVSLKPSCGELLSHNVQTFVLRNPWILRRKPRNFLSQIYTLFWRSSVHYNFY